MNRLEIKRINGYEDFYMIDNLGNVISLPRFDSNKNQYSGYHCLSYRINKFGYCQVVLSIKNVSKTF